MTWASSQVGLHAFLHQVCPARWDGFVDRPSLVWEVGPTHITSSTGEREREREREREKQRERERERTGKRWVDHQSVTRWSVRTELQVRGKILLDPHWVIQGTISLHDLSFFVDKELGEIPLDAVPQEPSSIGLLLQPLPQGVGVVPVHVDLTEQIELSVVGLGELLDLSIGARFLSSELVGREGQDA